MNRESTSDADRDREIVALITRHQAGLSAFCHSLVTDHSSADEVLQEASMVIWNKRAEFELGTNFRAWAFKIARFQVMAWRKREARRSARWLFDTDVVEQLADSAEPAFGEGYDERLGALRCCLEKLSADDRVLIGGHYEDDLPMEEHASRAGRSVGALRQVLYRIRQALRICIERTLAAEGLAHEG